MQKVDFVKAVAARSGVTPKEARATIDAALAIISETVAVGEKVTLIGFGTFERRNRQQRQGVHPQTRERIIIPARQAVGFVPGSDLRGAMQNETV